MKTILILLLLLTSCSKENNCVDDGIYKLHKAVDNQKRTEIVFPDDSCYKWEVKGINVKVYFWNGIKDSFCYNSHLDCNKVFFNHSQTFQYGELWKFLYLVKY